MSLKEDADLTNDAPDWRHRAACLGADTTAVFYYPQAPGRPGGIRATAKALCTRCPVRVECLDYAIEHGEVGVWGGTNAAERSRIRARRARAGPR